MAKFSPAERKTELLWVTSGAESLAEGTLIWQVTLRVYMSESKFTLHAIVKLSRWQKKTPYGR